MQGALLVMCLAWKVRQKQLGVDDFGQRIVTTDATASTADEVTPLLAGRA